MTKNKLLLITCFLVLSCSQNKTKKPKKSDIDTLSKKEIKASKIKKKVASAKKIETDTINRKNVVKFLKAYGKENKETQVLIETRLGNIKIQLYKDTPLHRASFIFLTKTGYFNTTSFHRIIKDFIVQGGNSDFPITRKLRMKYNNYRIPAEFLSYRKHNYGALSAARIYENNPEKTSSPFEFYIIQRKAGSYHLDGEHTIFGEVISGMDVVNKIAQLETDKKEWPIKEVFIKAKVIK